jgi:hypothetical protein
MPVFGRKDRTYSRREVVLKTNSVLLKKYKAKKSTSFATDAFSNV